MTATVKTEGDSSTKPLTTKPPLSLADAYEKELQLALDALYRACRIRYPTVTERSLFLEDRISTLLKFLKPQMINPHALNPQKKTDLDEALPPPPVLYNEVPKPPRKRRWDVCANECIVIDADLSQISPKKSNHGQNTPRNKRKTRWDCSEN